MSSIRNVVRVVAIANLAYFLLEFTLAFKFESVSLFADSIDFLEDASVNILIFVALGWSLSARRRLSKFFAILLLVPAISVIASIIYKLHNPIPPSAAGITSIATGALIVNFTCAFLLAKFRENHQSLVMAAYLSARNDAFANLAIITAGVVTLFWLSPVPDLVVGITIGMLNADAALKVWRSSEH